MRSTRTRLAVVLVASAIALAVTFWSTETTFNVTAVSEAVRIVIVPEPPTRLELDRVTMFLGFGGQPKEFSGEIELTRGTELVLERVSQGPLRIAIRPATRGDPVGVLFDMDGRPVEQPARVVIRIDNVRERATMGRSVVLPFVGEVELGRVVEQGSGHAMLRSADVTLLAHTLWGAGRYDAGRVRLDAGDRFRVDGSGPAYGFVSVDERSAMSIVYRLEGSRGQVTRFGAEGYNVSASVRARLLNDPVIQGVWLTFLAVVGLTGTLRKLGLIAGKGGASA